MANNDSLQKFRARVAKESLLKALLFSGMVMLGAAAAYTLLLNVFQARILSWVVVLCIVLLGLAAFGGSFAFFFLKVFKTKDENVAQRVDGLGFEERAVTMVEFSESDSFVAKKHREDTSEKMESIEPTSMKFKVPVLAIILLAIVTVFCVPSFFLLPNVMASAEEVKANQIVSNMVKQLKEEIDAAPIFKQHKDELLNDLNEYYKEIKEEKTVSGKLTLTQEMKVEILEKLHYYIELDEEYVKNMLDKLRQEVNDSEVSPETSEKLHDVINRLEQELANAPTPEEKVDKIQDAYEEIDKIREEDITFDEIGDDLVTEAEKTESDALKDLANAIQKGDEQGIKDALDKLKDEMQKSETKEELDQKINEVTGVIDGAIQDKPQNELKDALENLSGA